MVVTVSVMESLVPKGGIEPPRSQGPRDFETTSRSFEVVRRRSKQFETVQLGGRRRFGLVLSCSKDFEGVFTWFVTYPGLDGWGGQGLAPRTRPLVAS
jgi:hypothetical protein